jgi:glycosyltransferase involved in cell wall biosynthesis
MATQPLVSVLIPAHRAKTISSAAARSPLVQACPCWQAIIAQDDGSTTWSCWCAPGSAVP